jgi:hypothetical protein
VYESCRSCFSNDGGDGVAVLVRLSCVAASVSSSRKDPTKCECSCLLKSVEEYTFVTPILG